MALNWIEADWPLVVGKAMCVLAVAALLYTLASELPRCWWWRRRRMRKATREWLAHNERE